MLRRVRQVTPVTEASVHRDKYVEYFNGPGKVPFQKQNGGQQSTTVSSREFISNDTWKINSVGRSLNIVLYFIQPTLFQNKLCQVGCGPLYKPTSCVLTGSHY